MNSRGDAERPELLRRYLSEIGGIPVLTREQEVELASRLRAGEGLLRQELELIPYTARALHRRWCALRADHRVTGLLSEHHSGVRSGDHSAEVDRLLGRVGALLARRDKARAAARAQIDRRLVRAVRELRPRATELHRVLAELRARARRPEPGLVRETGLPGAELARRLVRAESAFASACEAKAAFVRHNLRLVVHQAKEFQHLGVPMLDLVQEGNLGLIRAVEKFDERQGNRFSTYGVWWIRQACVRAIQNSSRTVRVPSHLFDQLRRFRRARNDFESRHGRAPELADVAGVLARPVEEVAELARLDLRTVGIDEPVPGTEDATLADRLVDEEGLPADEQSDRGRLERSLARLLLSLEPRERRVVFARFGLADGQDRTLREVGEALGLSRERVRQIEQGALEKLQHAAGELGLSALLH